VPKNKGKMASARTTSTAVAQPDQFVSGVGRVAETLKPHVRSLIGLGIALAVVLIGYSVWNWQKSRKLTEATEHYHRALLIHEVPLASDLDPAGVAATSDDIRKLPARYPDARARAEATLVALDELARHDAGGVAREARLLRANVLAELGRFDDAAALYKAYAADATVPALKLDAQEGLGYALERKAAAEKDAAARQQGLEAALAAFAGIKAEDTDGKALALFHQGRILAVLGRTDEARKKLEEAKGAKPGPALLDDVEIRLQALDAPAPAPAPVPVDDAPAKGDAPAPAKGDAAAPAKGDAAAPAKAPAGADAPAEGN
jgi:tetratricopeptide (TPR) repeat protein